jgi:hypothetical protein
MKVQGYTVKIYKVDLANGSTKFKPAFCAEGKRCFRTFADYKEAYREASKVGATLSAGSKMPGYLFPPVHGDDSLGTLQPIIVAAHRQVEFWCGVRSPSPDELSQKYRALGRGASHVFPLWFASEVELVGGPIRGSLAGFMFLEDMNTKKIMTMT